MSFRFCGALARVGGPRCSELRVLVHEVVVVSNLPVAGALVKSRGQHIEQLAPSHVAFKAHHILRTLLVVITQQDLRVVLVLHKQLHWRLDQGGHCHTVRLAIGIKIINDISLVVFGSVVSAFGTEDGRL